MSSKKSLAKATLILKCAFLSVSKVRWTPILQISYDEPCLLRLPTGARHQSGGTTDVAQIRISADVEQMRFHRDSEVSAETLEYSCVSCILENES